MQPTLLTRLTAESLKELRRIAGSDDIHVMVPEEALMLSTPSSLKYRKEISKKYPNPLSFNPKKSCLFIQSDHWDRPHIDETCAFVAASRNGIFDEYELVIVPKERCQNLDKVISNLIDAGVSVLYDARTVTDIMESNDENIDLAEISEKIHDIGKNWLVSGKWLSVEQESMGFVLRYAQEVDEQFAFDNMLYRTTVTGSWPSSLITTIRYIAFEHWPDPKDPFAPTIPAQEDNIFIKVALACGYGGKIAERICEHGDFDLETAASAWLIQDSSLLVHEKARELEQDRIRMSETASIFLSKLEEHIQLDTIDTICIEAAQLCEECLSEINATAVLNCERESLRYRLAGVRALFKACGTNYALQAYDTGVPLEDIF